MFSPTGVKFTEKSSPRELGSSESGPEGGAGLSPEFSSGRVLQLQTGIINRRIKKVKSFFRVNFIINSHLRSGVTEISKKNSKGKPSYLNLAFDFNICKGDKTICHGWGWSGDQMVAGRLKRGIRLGTVGEF